MTVLSDLSTDANLGLVAMPAGTYRWSGAVRTGREGYLPFGTRYSGQNREFRVEPGRTSYPGEITIRSETRSGSDSFFPTA